MDKSIVIAGGGRLGRHIAVVLADYDHDVTIIEQDADRCETLLEASSGVIIQGDATRPGILEQAGLERADIFAAVTGDEGLNLALCATVEDLVEDIQTLARIREDIESKDIADSVAVPEAAGARTMVDEMLGRNLRSLQAATGEIDILEIEVDPRSPVAGKRLENVELPNGAQVISDADHSMVVGPETTLRPGHRYLVATEPAAADELRKLLVR
ncbi:MAG: TrkA family potassium uptake protein [Halolamina sp.]|uniref:potassium channel family protein n=1 Tax=Halolamina sp. TaxID=1940283 RepID=UPI002FC3374D